VLHTGNVFTFYFWRRPWDAITKDYCRTNSAEDEEIENFYSSLQAEVGKISWHDLLIIVGDINAKVG